MSTLMSETVFPKELTQMITSAISDNVYSQRYARRQSGLNILLELVPQV
jgi:hypothetical protein